MLWMETSLAGLGSAPGHEEWQPLIGDPNIQPLYLAARVPKERKPEESLSQSNVRCEVGGSSPLYNEVFFWPFFLRNLAIMIKCLSRCAHSVFRENKIAGPFNARILSPNITFFRKLWLKYQPEKNGQNFEAFEFKKFKRNLTLKASNRWPLNQMSFCIASCTQSSL